MTSNLLFVVSFLLIISPCLSVTLPPPTLSPTADSFDCGFCEFIITLIYGFVAENSTESQIITVVDGICAYVPNSLSALCDSFIDEYGPTIIYLLLQRESPSFVCTILTLCNDTTVTIFPDNTNNTIAMQYPTCKWCEWISKTFLNRLVTERSTNDKLIKRILQIACEKRIGTEKQKCHAKLEQYGDQLISEIRNAKQMNPSTKVCGIQQLSLCPSTM